jgi:para-nitrobenzyl esterase
MKKIVRLLLLLSLYTVSAHATDSRPIVQIDAGKLQGAVEYNMNVFKSIPYAAPPVGDLRWRPPQAALPWSGVRDAF